MKRLLFITIMSVFLWMGFICAISFMESWLKFQAPGVTLSAGLGIGKIVFGALNKMEWVFALIVFIYFVLNRGAPGKLWYGCVVLILIAQTFWLLPGLDARADIIISGKETPPSSLHWIFVIAELVKVVLLLFFSIALFKRYARNTDQKNI